MRVQVEIVCAPHPAVEVEAALRAAGRHMARTADSVAVTIDPSAPRIAVLEFDMRRAAQVGESPFTSRPSLRSSVACVGMEG